MGARESRGRLTAVVPIVPIHDSGDPRLDDYRNITDADLIARRGIFIAEGRLVVTRLLSESRFRTRSVLVTEVAWRALSHSLAGRPDVLVMIVDQDVMNGVAGIHIHRGCLAVGERPSQLAWQDIVTTATTVVALERIGDANNVGALFRNAAAFGVDAVLLDPATTDPLYRKAIRTSMAAALKVPFSRVDNWPAALTALRDMGFSVIALTPNPDAQPLEECILTVRGGRTAMVLGHEGEGLTAAALAACEHHTRIPMTSGIDSVNVATAAAIALYELRERGGRERREGRNDG